MATKKLRIATAEDFAPTEETVQLPSQQGTDAGVLLRRPDVVNIVASDGNVPDLLTAQVVDMIEGKQPNGKNPLAQGDAQENVRQVMQLVNIVCTAAFVDPPVHNDGSDEKDAQGRIPVQWLDFNDRTFVFEWALGGNFDKLQSFRPESDDAVPDGADRAPDGDQAE